MSTSACSTLIVYIFMSPRSNPWPYVRKNGTLMSTIIGIQEQTTLWCRLEDMFQLIVTPQGIEKVVIQLKDTPSKVYAISAELFSSKVPLEVLQN